jgi:3',5'-cyclic AMP phosphodiesterase CpdA
MISVSAAADVGWCGLRGAELTGRMLDSLPGPILLPGDVAYPDGTATDFANCYDPFWGRHRDRTFPVPGNHEYHSPGAAPYFAYFGPNAGPPGLGYYSREMGPWLVVALNSNIPIGEGSAQLQWLRSTLAFNPVRCTLAFWHHPRFSSGPNGDNRSVSDAFRALYEAQVDLLLVGHDHLYERMVPFDPDGRPDPVRGIRQFTVGTGGAQLYGVASVKPTSESRASVWGVLRLNLWTDGYDFEFLSVPGESFRDAGSGQCH